MFHATARRDSKEGIVVQFLKRFYSDATRNLYSKKLAQFVRSTGVTSDELLEMAKKGPLPKST